MEQKAIYDLLAEKLGAGALGWHEDEIESWAEISPADITAACIFLRDEARLDFNQLMCLSGLDWDGYDEAGKGKSVSILGYTGEGSPETSDRVGEGDFGVAYHLYSHGQKHKFTLRVRVSRGQAAVSSVAEVWLTAAWHEREAWDLVGIKFVGHQDLRRMLLDEAWEGHPLRKDYQMPGSWAGVPLEGRQYAHNPFPSPEPPAGDEKPSGDTPPAEA